MTRLFRIAAAALVAVSACLPAAPRAGDAPAKPLRPVVFRTKTMGTWATLTIVTADSAAVADLAYRSLLVLHHVDSLMSNWTETSEVARINREAGRGEVVVDPEVAQVLTLADEVTRVTGGAMDLTVEPLVRLWGFLGGKPHVPKPEEIAAAKERVGPKLMHFDPARGTLRFARADTRIDLGGIAKGYGVDRAADVLRGGHATDALIDLSGNMVALGHAAGKEGWTVGILDPRGERPYLGTLRLHDEAISTSGNYEQFVDADGTRYSHIIDPRTGWPAQGLVSVTVVSSTGMRCDAWDTGLFVMGSGKARALAKARTDLAVVIVEPAAEDRLIVWVEEALRSRFQIEAGAAGTVEVRYF